MTDVSASRKTLTTIFTGHTLCLTDIAAISPVMVATKNDSLFTRKTLYVEILMVNLPSAIRHDQHSMTTMGGEATTEQREQWSKQVKELETGRQALVDQWKIAINDR